jgi:hypothetical protein
MKMTKPKRFQYQIQYVDNTYRMVDWSKPEFNQVAMAMSKEQTVTVLEDSLFVLKDIRTIVLIPEIPEPKAPSKDENQLTEWGFVDDPTAVYLKDVLGIDLGQLGGN